MTDDNIELTRRKILGSVGAVGAAGAAAGLGTSALFSDDESFENNSITAGTLDMTVDAKVPNHGINDAWAGAVGFDGYDPETADGPPGVGVTLEDMKPGDWVILCYEIGVETNPACLGLKTENTANDDNGLTEPEESGGGDSTGGDGEGELAQNLEVAVYDDLNESALDGSLSGAETALSSKLLGDVTLQDVWDTFDSGDAIAADTTSFDFYVLLELPTATGNVVQSDSVEWDFVFDAVQSRNTDEDPYGNVCTPVWEDGGDECDCPESNFTAGSTDDDFSNLLSVGPDPDSGFPEIDARLRVDTTDGNAGDLTASDFAINEAGCGQTINDVAFESGGAVDIVVVFDDTGSMDDEIDTLQSEVTSLTNDLESAGVDARYALVSFEDSAELDQDFTDASTFQTAVNDLLAFGGGEFPEDNLDAIAIGTGNAAGQDGSGGSLSSFRSGAQRVLIDITDAAGHDEGDHSSVGDPGTTRFSRSDIESQLNTGNFSYYAVAEDEGYSDNDEYVSKRNIANSVDDGTFQDINSADFSVILGDIEDALTEEAYIVSYTTACPDEDGTDRTVDIEVDDPVEGMLYEQGSYTAPGGGT